MNSRSACEPTPWARTARWLPDARTRFFSPVLRTRAHWYRGIPTFDAFAPQFDAYPSTLRDPVSAMPDSSLTPEQLYRFYEKLPTRELVDSLGPTVLSPLRTWVQANARLANLWPADEMIHSLVYNASQAHARHVSLTIVGTYQVSVDMPGVPRRIYYARTADLPSQSYLLIRKTKRNDRTTRSPWYADQFIGVELWTMMASTLDSLPTHWVSGMRAQQPWHVAWPDDAQPYPLPAEIDPWIFFLSQPDQAAQAAYRRLEEWFDAHWDAGTLPRFMGSFMLTAEGHPHLREAVRLGSAGTLTIEAQWLSSVTVRRAY